MWGQVSTMHAVTDVYMTISASTSTGATVLSGEMLSFVVKMTTDLMALMVKHAFRALRRLLQFILNLN